MSFIRVVLPNDEFVSTEVFKWKETDVDDVYIKCPKCKKDTEPSPKVDITQHGFFVHKVFTVFQCQRCNQYFALEYHLTVEEENK